MYHSLREPQNQKQNSTQLPLTGQDTLVLFGELFDRGYANGLVEEAQKRGAKVISGTVGRRDENLNLRPLNAEELAQKTLPVINVPLEAGFDLETLSDGSRVVDQLKSVKLSDWENTKIDFGQIEVAKKNARERFCKNTLQFLKELDQKVPATGNIVIAHLMAGGVPRTKIVMPLMNRIVKGLGDRHLASETFWNSSIGRLCAENFFEVTAETFSLLIQTAKEFCEKRIRNGQKVAFTAYGYHGTEILMDNQYVWQSYAPYLQGWAKLRLETYAKDYSSNGVMATVYNCPEILTNSSSIFQGVEVCLYPLIQAMEYELGENNDKVRNLKNKASALLKEGATIQQVLMLAQKFLKDPLIRSFCDFENFPRHNAQAQMELMLGTSDAIRQMHKDEKNLMTGELSEIVLMACGKAILDDCLSHADPVSWINHDYVARYYGLS